MMRPMWAEGANKKEAWWRQCLTALQLYGKLLKRQRGSRQRLALAKQLAMMGGPPLPGNREDEELSYEEQWEIADLAHHLVNDFGQLYVEQVEHLANKQRESGTE